MSWTQDVDPPHRTPLIPMRSIVCGMCQNKPDPWRRQSQPQRTRSICCQSLSATSLEVLRSPMPLRVRAVLTAWGGPPQYKYLMLWLIGEVVPFLYRIRYLRWINPTVTIINLNAFALLQLQNLRNDLQINRHTISENQQLTSRKCFFKSHVKRQVSPSLQLGIVESNSQMCLWKLLYTR